MHWLLISIGEKNVQNEMFPALSFKYESSKSTLRTSRLGGWQYGCSSAWAKIYKAQTKNARKRARMGGILETDAKAHIAGRPMRNMCLAKGRRLSRGGRGVSTHGENEPGILLNLRTVIGGSSIRRATRPQTLFKLYKRIMSWPYCK